MTMACGESPADIPVVIFAGGEAVDLQGRLQPKACVRVADRPMLDHVVGHYVMHGFRRFIVCSGIGHEQIVHEAETLRRKADGPASGGSVIDVVFTGESDGTARRLREALRLLPNARTVAVSYVDIISNVDLAAVRETHEAESAAATLTAVNLPTRFMPLGVNPFSARVRGLAPKPITEETLVSGGYYFINQERFANAVGHWQSHESFEGETLPCLAAAAALFYGKHDGYWQPIDSGRDVRMAEKYLLDRRP
jgi:glucose-1-phosphate cytidylyltransferase